MPWRRKSQSTLVFLPGEPHRRRRLVGYSPWGCKESDMTERLHFHTVLWTSVHSSSGTLLIRSSPLNLFITATTNSSGIWYKSYLAGLVFFLVFFSLSFNFAITSWWTELQSAPGFVFADCIQLSILGYKEHSQFDFGIDHLVMSMCKVVSCVVEKGYLLWLVHSLGRIQLTSAWLHFVLQGQTCLLFQVYPNFVLVRSSPQWWTEHLF